MAFITFIQETVEPVTLFQISFCEHDVFGFERDVSFCLSDFCRYDFPRTFDDNFFEFIIKEIK